MSVNVLYRTAGSAASIDATERIWFHAFGVSAYGPTAPDLNVCQSDGRNSVSKVATIAGTAATGSR